MNYAFDVIFELIKPLDYEAVLSSDVPLHVSITLVDELRTITPANFTSKEDLKEALRAGAWLPLATSGSATFRGQRAIDGGVLTCHPSRLAIADDCTHVLSLSTRPTTYQRMRPDLLQLYASVRLNRMRSGLGTKFLEATQTCSLDRMALKEWRINPREKPAVLDLCPLHESGVTRHDINTGRLHTVARTAYETMSWALTGTFERAFPKLTTLAQERNICDGRSL